MTSTRLREFPSQTERSRSASEKVYRSEVPSIARLTPALTRKKNRMSKPKKFTLLLAPAAAIGLALIAPAAASASASAATSYQATLDSINGSGGSGTVMIEVNGTQATITEHVTGLADKFGGNAYPHVQHIHIGAKGQCPTTAADANKDGVISTTEGAPSYGAIGATLSTSGDTSPAAGLTLTVAPTGGSFDYMRTTTLDAKVLDALKGGTAVIVVHGLDPATLSKTAQGEKSDLVPALPLAATSPALCGAVKASQMTTVPGGSAGTGGGSTAGVQDEALLNAGGALLVAGAVVGGFALRRRNAATN